MTEAQQEPIDHNGYALKALRDGQPETAVAILERGLEDQPLDPRMTNNLVNALTRIGRFDRAIQLAGELLAERPDVTEVFNNLGQAHWGKGQIEQAVAAFRAAAVLTPNFHPPKFNLGALALMHGEYEQGWSGYDFRFSAKGQGLHYHKDRLWDGKYTEDLTIWGEQGLGDEVLQLSMAGSLLSSGLAKNITWECAPRLVEVFQRAYPEIKFVPLYPGIISRQVDKHLPAYSLGRLFRKSLADFPIRTRYISAGPGAARRSVPRIGISWHSQDSGHAKFKSSQLADWAPLLWHTGAEFVSLQYGNDTERREFPSILREGDPTNDIAGLVNTVASCDRVVTVSNTAAHLAGALGVPTLVLLSEEGAMPWYWGTEAKTPWYPSVEIMRRPIGESWHQFMQQVAARVGEKI